MSATTSTPATSTPATSTPATSTPATSTPATSTPATSTPATSTPATSPDGAGPPRSLDDLERDIAATRDRLAANVGELVGRMQPASLSRQARSRARSVVFDEQGRLRVPRVAAAAGAVAVVLLVRWMRARRQR